MKKLLSLLCLSLLCGDLNAGLFASTTENSLSIDISNTASGGLGLRYERNILPFINITVPLEVRFGSLTPLPTVAVNGLRIMAWSALPDAIALTGAGVKIHVQGWYIEGMLKAGFSQLEYLGNAGIKNLAVLQPSVYIGYSETLPFGLFVNMGIGVAYRQYFPSSDAKSFFQPDAVLAAGYGW